MRFEVYTMAKIWIKDFCIITLTLETAVFSEMLVTAYNSAKCHKLQYVIHTCIIKIHNLPK